MAKFRQTSVDGLKFKQSKIFFCLGEIGRDVELFRTCQVYDSELN